MKKQIATLAVDAGLMMLGDPCYVVGSEIGAMQWGDFLARFCSDEATLAYPIGERTAVVVSTGYGDGLYPVYAEIKDGRVKSITVEFISD